MNLHTAWIHELHRTRRLPLPAWTERYVVVAGEENTVTHLTPPVRRPIMSRKPQIRIELHHEAIGQQRCDDPIRPRLIVAPAHHVGSI